MTLGQLDVPCQHQQLAGQRSLQLFGLNPPGHALTVTADAVHTAVVAVLLVSVLGRRAVHGDSQMAQKAIRVRSQELTFVDTGLARNRACTRSQTSLLTR